MKQLKHIKQLYFLDWQRILKNPVAIFLVVSLMVLPSLYAWFNIKALWDPYGNTNELPIAIYNEDVGATINGQEIEIGDQVMEELHENHQLGWQFVDSKEALTKGVKSGKYYAGIYIPKEFSTDLLSFLDGEIKKPQLDYYFNAKINAIAPKITDKGASSLQEQITNTFIETASEKVFSAFNELGYQVEDNLLTINKIKNLVLTVDEHADEIEGYTKEVLALENELPELKQKLAKADEFVDYIPEVDELGAKLIAFNQKMPQLQEQAKVILTLQEKIPEIQAASQQLDMVDQDFDEIAATLTEGVTEAKQALQVISQVQTLLPQIEQLGQDASVFTEQTLNAAQQLDAHLDSVTTVVQTNLQMVIGLSESLTSYAHELNTILNHTEELTDEQRAAIKQVLQKISASLNQQQVMIDDFIAWLTQLQTQLGGDFSGIISYLTDIRDLEARAQQITNNLVGAIDTVNKADVQDFLQQLEQLASNIATIGQKIDVEKISQQIHDLLENQLIPALSNAQSLLTSAQTIDFASLLEATTKTISHAVTILEKYQQELPAIGQEIHDANQLLNGHLDDIIAGINKGAELYNQLPKVAEKLNQAADFMENDWPQVAQELTETLTVVNQKVPQVETAIHAASDLIKEDWPTLRQGVHKAAQAIHEGESIADLSEIIQLLKNDVQAESDFFANPVELKTTTMYPIANNGSASTPFYTALCLWVGALLLSSIATVDFHLEDKEKKRYSPRETFVARMLTFLTIGIGQALIVTLGNYFALGVDVRQPFYSVLFALLVGLTFMMIIYVLVGLFGNLGKGIGIILLVLSISGGGGNYPIQVSGAFFQFIHPLLPFTYAVDLLRESAGGIYWPNAWQQIMVLIGLFFSFALIGTWVSPLMTKPKNRFEELTKQSHFFH